MGIALACCQCVILFLQFMAEKKKEIKKKKNFLFTKKKFFFASIFFLVCLLSDLINTAHDKALLVGEERCVMV